MLRREIAWRGFVDVEGGVIAWPTVLIEHNDFHRMFGTDDHDFLARWRQWSPGGKIDIDSAGDNRANRLLIEAWIAGELSS